MIHIKNKLSIQTMARAGELLSTILEAVQQKIVPGISTAEIDTWIGECLQENNLVSCTKGYMGYQHVSCIAINDEVVHGVPRSTSILKTGDLVKIDVCASWNGYCADMARSFFVGKPSEDAKKLVDVAKQALDKGIEKARVGNRLSDISAAIQAEVEKYGFSVVRDFAGHGIGKQMHEDPEILNYGKPGCGPVLKEGMTFAIEPMITLGKHAVYIARDGWTVKTVDGSLAAHIEDTVAITNNGPMILTRKNSEQQNNKSVA
jgi:methionyl aminopeptidase